MSDAVQPIDVRKVSLVGSSFEGLTTIDDMRAFWLGRWGPAARPGRAATLVAVDDLA